MSQVFVTPVSNSVCDQHGNPYPAKGVLIKRTVYVQRLINDGSLIEKVETMKKIEIVSDDQSEKKGKK